MTRQSLSLFSGETVHRGQCDVAVVGTRGVPARYGGFETLAEHLARNVDVRQVKLTLYGQRSAYSGQERAGGFSGHDRVWLPLSAGGAQSLIHDALQLFHAAFVRRHSHILLLGTSAAWLLPLVRLCRRRIRVVTNIDGLEWRRGKFGWFTRGLLKALEAVAVRFSDTVIADNDALVPIVRDIHGIEPVMITYGADHVIMPDPAASPHDGHMLAIARIEPENNTAMILQAARMTTTRTVFIGNWNATDYGRRLRVEFDGVDGLVLVDPIYDQDMLVPYRANTSAYLHGHSVGGTNPSLVEAIFHAERILAFDCAFNRATLNGHGAYFNSAEKLADLMCQPRSGYIQPDALNDLRARYRWRSITQQYLETLGCC